MDAVAFQKRSFGSDRKTEQTRSHIEQKSMGSGTKDKSDKKLRDLYNLAEKIKGVLDDYTAEGLKEVNRPLHTMGIFDGTGKGLTPEAKAENQQIEIKNITSAVHYADDLEKLYKKVLEILKCIKRAKNISKQAKKTNKDLSNRAESFDNMSKRLDDILHANKIKQTFDVLGTKTLLTESIDSLRNFCKDYQEHQKNTEKIINNQIEIASTEQEKEDFKSLLSSRKKFNEALDTLIKAHDSQQDTVEAKKKIVDVCDKLRTQEQKAAQYIRDNAQYIRDNAKNEYELVQNCLNKFFVDDSLALANKSLSHAKAYLYAYPRVGRMVLGTIFMDMTRIEKLEGKNGNLEFAFDTTRGMLVIDSLTREGVAHNEKIYTRTLADGYLEIGDNVKIELIYPEDSATKRDNGVCKISRKINGEWVESEKLLDLRTSRDIHIKKHYSNGEVQVDVQILHDVMPKLPKDYKQDIEDLRKAGKDGFSPEQVQRMFRFDLERNEYVPANGRDFPLEMFNKNAIKWIGDKLVWRHEGPTLNGMNISIEMLGWDLQSLKVSNHASELNKNLNDCASEAFKAIKESFDNNDDKLLESVYNRVADEFEQLAPQFGIARRKFLDVTREPLERIEASKEEVEKESRRIKEISDNATRKVANAERIFNEKLKAKCYEVLNSDNDKRLEKKNELLGDLSKNVYQLGEEPFDVKLYDKSAIVKMAKDAGEAAAYIAKEVEGKEDKDANKVRKDREKRVINDYFAALEKYQKNKDEKTFQTAIKDIDKYTSDMRAKAAIAKIAKATAEQIEDPEKQIIIGEIAYDAAEKEMKKAIAGHVNALDSYIRQDLSGDSTTNRRAKKIEKCRLHIEKMVEDSKEDRSIEKCQKVLEKVVTYISQVKKQEKNKNVILDINKAMDEVRNCGECSKKQHEDTIKAGVEKYFELKVYDNDIEDGIKQEDLELVEELRTTALEKCGERLKGVINNIIDNLIIIPRNTDIKNKVQTISTQPFTFEQYEQYVNKVISYMGKEFVCKDIKKIYKIENDNQGIDLIKGEMKEELKKIEQSVIKEVCEDSVAITAKVKIREENSEEAKKNKKQQQDIEKAGKDAKETAQKDWDNNNNPDKRKRMAAKYQFERVSKEEDIITKARSFFVQNFSASNTNTKEYKEIDNILTELETEAKKSEEDRAKMLKGDRTDKLNPAQLIQEWYRLEPYAAKDPPGNNLSLADYRQKHAKREQIENILFTDKDVHWSHRFHFCVAKAYETAIDNNYWFREKIKGTQEKGVFGYLSQCLTDIKAEMESHGTPQTPLERSRAAFLHQAVQAIHSAMNDGYPRQTNEVLLPVLGSVLRILNANLDKREHVKQALALENPGKAKEMLENKLNADSQKSVLGLDRVKDDPNEKKESTAAQIEKRLMKNGHFDFGELEKMSPSEMMEWRSALRGRCEKRAKEIFEARLEGLNSEQRAIEERNRHDSIRKISKDLWGAYLETEKKSFELYKCRILTKESNRQRMHDFFYAFLLLGMQGFQANGSRTINNFMTDLQKVLGMAS
jgi:hypothetical protein